MNLVDPAEVFAQHTETEQNDAGGKEDGHDQGSISQRNVENHFFDDEIGTEDKGYQGNDESPVNQKFQWDHGIIKNQVCKEFEEPGNGIA